MPSLFDYLDVFGKTIGLPKSNAKINIDPPTHNDWSKTYTAPNNGRYFFFAAECVALCVSNTSTGEMQYVREISQTTDNLDLAFSIRCKKGDTINLFYGVNENKDGRDLTCWFIPDTNA